MPTSALGITSYSVTTTNSQTNIAGTLDTSTPGIFDYTGASSIAAGPATDQINITITPNPTPFVTASGDLDYSGLPGGATISAIRVSAVGAANYDLAAHAEGTGAGFYSAGVQWYCILGYCADVDLATASGYGSSLAWLDASVAGTITDSGGTGPSDADSSSGTFSGSFAPPATLTEVMFFPSKTIAEVQALYGAIVFAFYVTSTAQYVVSSGAVVGASTADTDVAQSMTVTIEVDYDASAAVTDVSPAHGDAAGGTVVTLTGTGFTGTTTATFNGSTTLFTPSSDVSGTCVTPAHAVGAVTVSVS